MTRPAIEVADIVRRKGKQFLERFKAVLSYQQLKAYRAVKRCRTAALGGHRDKCEDCTVRSTLLVQLMPIRCCPKCQAQARRRWLQIQQRDLLNTNYFHVVFTLPHELNPLALTSRRPLLDLLFDASSQTLLEVAADPKRLGAEIGFLSILHTWRSNLLPHYHIHCVVPGGGLSADHQRWIHTSHPMFLLPVPVLRTVFRKKFLAGLVTSTARACSTSEARRSLHDPASFEQLIEKLGNKNWYVYAKPPFGGPEHVLRYLGRYTHRMAISNHRITGFDGERVSFRWRDYAHGGKQRVMTLDAVNFLCRFFLHVLPKGFVRIRRYGLLSNRFRKQLLPLARTLLAQQGREPLPLPPCLIALPGTAPVAEKPCASSSASPPQNSISQASIPHEHRRQHAPTACSLHVSTPVCASRSEQLRRYAHSHPEIAACKSPCPTGSKLSIINDEKPAPGITHRKSKSYSISIIPVRITATAVRLRLPSYLLIENASQPHLPSRSCRARDVSDVG
jgi:hypothetical protein